MSDKLDATISITADTSGVEAGVDKTKKSLKTLGSAAQQAAGKISESGKAAGAGMDAIGRGSEQAAKAVERSTRSMQLQLQRQIAEMQAGGKATREYTEALARMRGVDVANLRPLLDQLDAARKKTDDAKKSAEGFAGGLASMKTAVAGFATALAGGALFARFIAETKAAEQEQAQLAAVLKSTGEAAGWSQAQLNKMADTLASKSTYSSGAINEAQTRLLSYTNIAGKEFPRAMQAVIDMSARMGMDVKSSAETIGRALDIPSEGLTALTRQGFRFTESQKELVKQLEATGDVGQAQAIILEALESSYGGAAEAARNTFGGALQSVQNSIGSLLTADGESMGSLTNSVNDLNSLLQSDGTKQAFAFYVELMVSSASAAARLAAALAGLKNGGIGAFLGHAASDNAATELVSIETKIANLTKTRDGLSSNWWGRLTQADNIAIANKQLDAMQQQREVLLQYVNDGVDGYEKLGEANANFLAQQEKTAAAPVFDGLVASALEATKAYKSKAEQMAEVQEQGDKLRAALKQLEDGEKGASKEAKQLRERLRGVDERLASMAKSGTAGAAGLKNVESAYATLSKRVNEYISQLALEAKQGDKVTAAQKLQIQLDELLEKSKGKLAAAEVARLKAGIQSALSMEKEAAASKLAAAQAEEAAKAYDSVLDATMGRTKSLADQVRAEEEAAAVIGLSQEAVAALEMAKLSDMAATIERKALLMDDIDLSGQQSAALRAEAQAYRDLASVKGQRAVKQANADTAKKAKEDWEKVSKTIGDTLADYIMGGGKDAAQYLKRLFSTLVLQPVVQTVVGGIMGTGAAAASGAVSGGLMDRLSNSAGGFTNWSTWGSTASGWASDASFKLVSNGWTEMGSSMLDLSRTITSVDSYLKDIPGMSGGIGSAAGYLGSIYSLTQGNYGSALGSAIGTWALPGIGTMIGGMLGGLFDGLDDSGTPHMGGSAMWSAATGGKTNLDLLNTSQTDNPLSNIDNQFASGFGWVQDREEVRTALSGLAQGLGSSLDSFAKSFGSAFGYEVALGFADDTSKDGAWGALRIALGEQEIVNWNDSRQSKWAPRSFADGEEGYKQFLNDVFLDVKSALISMDLPAWADQILDASSDIDTINASLQQIGATRLIFDQLGQSMQMFSGISGDLQTQLLMASGGIESLSANAGTFYQGFFDESERMEALNQQLRDALSGLDLSLDPAMGEAAKEQFRATVEAAMAGGQGELASQLLAMSGSFAAAADAAQKSIQEMADAAAEAQARIDEIYGQQHDLWADIADAYGDYATAAQRRYWIETEGMSAAEQAAYDYIEAIRSQVSAAQAASASLKSLADEQYQLQNQLLTQSGQGAWAQQRDDERQLAQLLEGLSPEAAAQVREQFSVNVALRDQYAANNAAIEGWRQSLQLAQQEQQQLQQSQRGSAQGIAESARTAVSGLQSIFDMLETSVNSLRGNVDSAAQMQAQQARDFIAQATLLMRSGTVVDSGKLQAAIRAATTGIDAGIYGNSAAQDYDRLVLAGELAALQSETGVQLSVAEQHLSVAEQQLAALDGISVAIRSLVDAQSVGAKAIAKDQWQTVDGNMVWSSAGGAVGVNTGSDIDIWGKDGSKVLGSEAIAFVRNQAAVGDLRSVYDAAVRMGISAVALDSLMGWDAGTANDWAKKNKLPQFAAGGYHSGGAHIVGEYGPELRFDGPARYYSAQQSQSMLRSALGGAGGGNQARLEQLVEGLTSEVKRLQGLLVESNRNTGDTADVLARVTRNGQGMITQDAPI